MDGSIQPGPNPRRRPISFGSYRGPIFCKDCNAHFKRLEDAVIPIMVPMAKGFTLRLGTEEQRLLALWCVKTAMALLSAEPGEQDAVPIEHRTGLREREEIVADTWVGLFRWHGEPVIVTGNGISRNIEQPSFTRKTYNTMLAFEGFGFYVTAFNDPIGEDAYLSGDQPPMLSFWPSRSRLMPWPPPTIDNRILPRNLFTGWTPLQSG
jgi:hypothetical protein